MLILVFHQDDGISIISYVVVRYCFLFTFSCFIVDLIDDQFQLDSVALVAHVRTAIGLMKLVVVVEFI
jgi:hypothetical protein